MLKRLPRSSLFIFCYNLVMSEIVEKNCRVGVVTWVEDHAAQLLYLYSRKANTSEDLDTTDGFEDYIERFGSQGAIDTDEEGSFALIDYLRSDLEQQIELPEEGVRVGGGCLGVVSERMLGDAWSNLKKGSLVHEHSMSEMTSPKSERFWDEYCVSSIVLDEHALLQAVSAANEQRQNNLKKVIADLELAEQKLLEDHEVIEDPAADILLFKGLHEVTDERGRTYWKVPERVIVSNRHGILCLSVTLWHQPDMDDGQLDWTGQVGFLVGDDKTTATELWVPYCCPFEAVDERGVPLERNKKRVRVEINLCSPYRSLSAARGLEEERLIAEANGQQYIAQLDSDRAAGDQGLGGINFTSFRNTASEQTYHELREFGSKKPSECGTLTGPIASDLLIPLEDIDESLDFHIRFPGLGNL